MVRINHRIQLTPAILTASQAKSNHHPSHHSPFTPSKKDKSRIKHTQFLSKITKSHTKPKPHRRRRPNKKLVTTLEDLASALPSTPDISVGKRTQNTETVIRQRSLKSRAGALKRRDKLERGERERFGRNMAALATGVGDDDGVSAGAEDARTNMGIRTERSGGSMAVERFAALRRFIGSTMERRGGLVVDGKEGDG